MARKKIVFVIVEGPSDEEALGVLLNRIYNNDTVFVQIMHRDITAQYGNSSANIIAAVVKEVHAYAKSNHYKKDDFREIIHIIDMDGAYIPDSNIIEDEQAKRTEYSLTNIRTRNIERIVQRNSLKRSNINKLCSCPDIWGIPYKDWQK